MKYLIIGAGGTGGCLAAYMLRAGLDTELIARGQHLAAMREQGLQLDMAWQQEKLTTSVQAYTMEEYTGTPDVILICVKSYSLEAIAPFIAAHSHPKTIVIPILNVYGTGGRLHEKLPQLLVTDGCIYVSANIREPGCIIMYGKLLRLVFGVRDKQEQRPELAQIAADLQAAGIKAVLSDNIKRDAYQKFSFVSPMAACGAYYEVRAAGIQSQGEIRESFIKMVQEAAAVGRAMGIEVAEDIVDRNLTILDHLAPDSTTSMQLDIELGHQSELDGLVFEVVRQAHRCGVDVPLYERTARKFNFVN